MNDLLPLFDAEELCVRPLVIAGPCSAETESQVMSTARDLSRAGIKIYRAGIWKPRTKPGGFEGIGVEGLAWLQEVKQELGMLTATEVANRRHVMEALSAGIDLLWIGARTSANPFAMQEVADSLAEAKVDIPVLVKNPITPDLELWIGALQRIYNAGIRRLGAIHRGFNTFGKHIYRNVPQWEVPIELHRRMPNLPLICDPSHIGGKRELISPLSQQALDMDFDGLMIESHCEPDVAWSDKNQQVTPQVLEVILDNLIRRSGAPENSEKISQLRRQIDEIDNELIELFARRMDVSKQIGQYKKDHNMQVLQPGRYRQLMQAASRSGEQLGLSPEFVQSVFEAIHVESVRHQLDIL